MAHAENSIQIELAWSPSEGEVLRRALALPEGSTIADAIASSGWDLPPDLVSAVWGRAREASHRLCNGDRLELLRPLRVDPMEARRRRHRGAQQATK